MKRQAAWFLTIIAAFTAFSSCRSFRTAKENHPNASLPLASANVTSSTIAALSDKICLKEGDSASGETILTRDDFTGYDSSCNNQNGKYQLTFYLTADGQKALSEKTKELVGKSVSLWEGDELIASVSVMEPITGDSFCIDVDKSKIDKI